MNLSFNFSMAGFLLVLLPILPNVLYFIFLEKFGSETSPNSHRTLDMIEHGAQFIFIGLLIFFEPINQPVISMSLVSIIALFLIFYYLLWGLLFLGRKTLTILLAMSIVPVIYFILGAILLRNFLAIIPMIISLIFHVLITYFNYKSSKPLHL